MVKVPERRSATIADRILDEAERQVLRLESGKLRVVDVASALGMSHANIYRHFEGRHGLLDGLVRRWLADSEARSRAAFVNASNACDMLSSLVLDSHAATRAKLQSGPGVIEIYQQAFHHNADAVAEHAKLLQGLAREALEIGRNDGVFAVKEAQIEHALMTFSAVTMRFMHPLLIAATLEHDTLNEARAVTKLYVEALKSAPNAFALH